MWTYNQNPYELYHHGILGMKWGVRRYQNPDGSLTSAGRNRYGVGPAIKEKFSKVFNKDSKTSSGTQTHEQKLVDKYKAQGMNQNNAELAAKNRLKTEKVLKIAGGLTLAAAAAYGVNKYNKEYVDKVIKAGTEIQNTTTNDNEDYNRTFWAAKTARDKELYGKYYPREQMNREIMDHLFDPDFSSPSTNVNTLRVKKDIKEASMNTSRKVFKEMAKKNPEFAKKAAEAMSQTQYNADVDKFKRTGKITNKMADYFNASLGTPEVQKSGVADTFYDELSKRGYGALADTNDRKLSGFSPIAKSPSIIIGKNVTKDSLEKIATKHLSDAEVNKQAEDIEPYLMGILKRQTTMRQIGAYAAAYGLEIGAVAGANELGRSKKRNDYMKRHKNEQFKNNKELDTAIGKEYLAVQKYKREHKGTRLTDRQIRDMLYNKKR